MTDTISCPFGTVAPRSISSLAVAVTASAEQGTDEEGVYVFVGRVAEVFVLFDRAGSVAAPTTGTGFPIKVAADPLALRLPRGTRFRAISGSPATLYWYRSDE